MVGHSGSAQTRGACRGLGFVGVPLRRAGSLTQREVGPEGEERVRDLGVDRGDEAGEAGDLLGVDVMVAPLRQRSTRRLKSDPPDALPGLPNGGVRSSLEDARDGSGSCHSTQGAHRGGLGYG